MSPMEQLAKQEYERGYSDGKSDYFAAGVAEGEMRARQRMIANRVVANQHPFAASGKPIDHIASTGKMIGCAYCDNPLFAGTKCNNCGRVTIAEPANTRSTSEYLEPVKQEPVHCHERQWVDLPVACDCGDVYPADSFGAGFIAATGRCQNCDVAAPVSEKREWVDLTDDEIVSEFNKSRNNFDYASAVIAAFKEKNR